MTQALLEPSSIKSRVVAKPRLGFLGAGWIGRNRLAAIAKSNLAEIIAIGDSVAENAKAALEVAPDAEIVSTLEELLDMELDGIVIATPSALHADQAIAALKSGAAVFCQKPLARTRSETAAVIAAARQANQLLAVDLSYRFIQGARQIPSLIQSGDLGKIFAVDLIFHNGYGPDKPWFYDKKLAGGGCVIDLGIHLVDLAFWALGAVKVKEINSRLFSQGEPSELNPNRVEDYAVARIDLESGTTMQLACSWKLQAGCDAVISATFHGTKGGVSFHNVDGSFYDFETERFSGTKREIIASGPDEWGGRAGVDWLRRLAEGERYDPEIERLIDVAETLDRIYGR
jgi:predicted dehydrogenase